MAASGSGVRDPPQRKDNLQLKGLQGLPAACAGHRVRDDARAVMTGKLRQAIRRLCCLRQWQDDHAGLPPAVGRLAYGCAAQAKTARKNGCSMGRKLFYDPCEIAGLA